MLDLSNYTFIPAIESEDGLPYGLWVFEGNVPFEATVQEIIQNCMEEGYEWTLEDVTEKLDEMGYSVAFIHPDDPIYV